MSTNNNNNQNKKKKNNMLIIGGGAVLFMFLTFGIFVFMGSEDVKPTDTKIQSTNVNTGDPKDAVDKDYIDDVKALNARAASQAEKSGGSHIPVTVNSVSELEQSDADASLLEVKKASDVQVVQEEQQTVPVKEEISAVQQQPQPTVINVIEKETIKEVPVARFEPYDFKKDVSLISQFLYQKPQTSSELPVYALSESFDFEQEVAARQAAANGGGNMNVNGVANAGLSASSNHYQNQLSILEDANDKALGGDGKPIVESNTHVSVNGGAKGDIKSQVEGSKKKTMHTVGKRGEIMAAILETSINSNRKTIVRARIVEGDLDGAILTGTFTNNNTSVTIAFDSIAIPQAEKSYPISALAMDMKDASTAMATSVNKHIPERLLWTFASSFANAYSNALKSNNNQSSTRTVVDEVTGNQTTVNVNQTVKKTNKDLVREAGSNAIGEATNIVRETVPTTPTVKVKGNSEIAIYFMEDFQIPSSLYDELSY